MKIVDAAGSGARADPYSGLIGWPSPSKLPPLHSEQGGKLRASPGVLAISSKVTTDTMVMHVDAGG